MAPPNALSEAEQDRGAVRCCTLPKHCDLAVAQMWTWVLDDGSYRCWQATMQRILRAVREGRDGRGQRTDPAKKIPELMASRQERGLEVGTARS